MKFDLVFLDYIIECRHAWQSAFDANFQQVP